jgi:hypothetical protein
MSRENQEGRLLHVSQPQFWGCLVVALVVFSFARGPIWRHAGDIASLDLAIFWSYGAIPLLIGGCLLWSHRWSWRGVLLDSLALVLLKYGITYSIAMVLWATVAPPHGPPAAPAHAVSAAEPEPVVVPTPIDPARTGVIEATVVDAQGSPAAGALVYVAAGLEGYVFAPPTEPLVLEHGKEGVTPALAVAQVGQPIQGRSIDGRMHTMVATRDGGPLFNIPLLSSGASTPVRVREAHGMTILRCNVHPSEPTSRLLTLAHPFFRLTDAAGKVRLEGVPAGRLRLAAARGEESAVEDAVTLDAGATREVRLSLGR